MARAGAPRIAFPLELIHPQARKASEAAECAANQGRYCVLHKVREEDEGAYRDLRPALFRLATALVFVAAIGFLKTSVVRADTYPGTCAQIEVPYGCDYDLGQGWGPVCVTEGFCLTDPSSTSGQQYQCWCMAPYDCYWAPFPGGC
jgi:hypothetical protein